MTAFVLKTYVVTFVIDVNMSHTPEKGAHNPSWPNGLIITIILIIIIIILIILILIIMTERKPSSLVVLQRSQASP